MILIERCLVKTVVLQGEAVFLGCIQIIVIQNMTFRILCDVGCAEYNYMHRRVIKMVRWASSAHFNGECCHSCHLIVQYLAELADVGLLYRSDSG